MIFISFKNFSRVRKCRNTKLKGFKLFTSINGLFTLDGTNEKINRPFYLHESQYKTSYLFGIRPKSKRILQFSVTLRDTNSKHTQLDTGNNHIKSRQQNLN